MTFAKSIDLLQMVPGSSGEVMPFIIQPIMRPFQTDVFGYEVLYRGRSSSKWRDVDLKMLRFLSRIKVRVSLFVNLANETILTIDEDLLFAANRLNSIFFEWSEVVSNEEDFKHIVDKINAWTKRGLRFVIDDFGAGRDGFERLFAVERIAAVKLDGKFFRHATQNAMAEKIVEHVIKACSGNGILTVAEAVETASDYDLAEGLGFDLVQGRYVDGYHADRQTIHAHA